MTEGRVAVKMQMKRRRRASDAQWITFERRFASVATLASAATITLPDESDLIDLTGTTPVTTINASRDARFVTLLIRAGVANGIVLGAGTGLVRTFQTTAAMTGDSALEIFWDGTAWTEVDRHYGDTWNAPAFVAGWGDVGAGNEVGGYLREADNTVKLKGYVTRTSGVSVTIFTLPLGYRPALAKRYAVAANNAFGQVRVLSTGAVNLITGAVTNVSLDGIMIDLS